MKTKKMVRAAMIAAIYVVLTIVIAPISYGSIQCRLSEVLLLFCISNPECIFGYAVGCVLANISSPLGLIDIVLGGSANLICGIFAYKVKKLKYVLPFVSVFNGIVVGAELSIVYGTPFLVNAVCVAVGELIALMVGVVLYRAIGKRIEKVW